MQLRADPVEAEQHDPEKAGFQEEGRQHFQPNYWADRWPGHLPEPGEAETEFERQDDPGDDADTETHGENAQPEPIDLLVEQILGLEPHSLDAREHTRVEGHGPISSA